MGIALERPYLHFYIAGVLVGVHMLPLSNKDVRMLPVPMSVYDCHTVTYLVIRMSNPLFPVPMSVTLSQV